MIDLFNLEICGYFVLEEQTCVNRDINKVFKISSQQKEDDNISPTQDPPNRSDWFHRRSASSAAALATCLISVTTGSILAHLLSSTHPFLQHTTITCLLRDPSRASKLTSVYGSRVSTLIYDSIDDLPATEAAAAQHDIVINTTIGYHAASGEALVRGLAQRKAETGHDVWIIHTSGTSNLADQPITKTWMNEDDPDGWELDDARDDVYAYEKMREALSAYPQRTAGQLSISPHSSALPTFLLP